MPFIAPFIKSAWQSRDERAWPAVQCRARRHGVGGITLAGLADAHRAAPDNSAVLAPEHAGMLCAALTGSAHQLAACRFMTGLGVGGMMPAINTVVAEYATARKSQRRHRYPGGGVSARWNPWRGVGDSAPGIVSAGAQSWLCSALLSSILIPVAFSWIPESKVFLDNHREAPFRHRCQFAGGLERDPWTGACRNNPAALYCDLFSCNSPLLRCQLAPLLLASSGAGCGARSPPGAVVLNCGEF